MIEINWPAAGVIISALISLMALAAWVGAINEKVKRNIKDISTDGDRNIRDHILIFQKLDYLRDLIKNGHG